MNRCGRFSCICLGICTPSVQGFDRHSVESKQIWTSGTFVGPTRGFAIAEIDPCERFHCHHFWHLPPPIGAIEDYVHTPLLNMPQSLKGVSPRSSTAPGVPLLCKGSWEHLQKTIGHLGRFGSDWFCGVEALNFTISEPKVKGVSTQTFGGLPSSWDLSPGWHEAKLVVGLKPPASTWFS